MIKAIFFDIDGTLVTNRSKALESTKQAINYARKNGILCGVATGRSPIKIKEIIDDLELDMYVVYNVNWFLLQIERLSTTLLNKKYWNILLNLQMLTIDKSFLVREIG